MTTFQTTIKDYSETRNIDYDFLRNYLIDVPLRLIEVTNDFAIFDGLSHYALSVVCGDNIYVYSYSDDRLIFTDSKRYDDWHRWVYCYKKCSSCETYLGATDFENFGLKRETETPYGKKHITLQSKCRECNKAYQKEHYSANKAEYIEKSKNWKEETRSWLKEYKSTLECSVCKENHPACLEFHHKNPDEKSCNVSNLISYGKQRILEEIKKCVVLCSNCHKKHHLLP